ncbi:hypothetical protein [Photorhabdus asymbiotica]|uniref:hypothetical protein n=1 Tax=Photorhabdus asymbiotica TaxID=291112 RepID=UPI003DA793E6
MIVIPVIFQVASLLVALTHPGHIVIYAPGDSFPCRRAATRNLLGIYCRKLKVIVRIELSNGLPVIRQVSLREYTRNAI